VREKPKSPTQKDKNSTKLLLRVIMVRTFSNYFVKTKKVILFTY